MVMVWLYGLSRDLGVTPVFLFLSVSLSLILFFNCFMIFYLVYFLIESQSFLLPLYSLNRLKA